MVVFLSEAGAAAPFVHQEIGAANQAGKIIVPIVQAGVGTRALAMLAGIEYIEVDLTHPAAAMATVSESLAPLVQAQAEKLRGVQPTAAPPSVAPAIPAPVLIGLGVLLLALVLYLDRTS
jgi:hypothetical protein